MQEHEHERYLRLEDLFRLAVELPHTERADFARRHADGDAEFERDLLALLSEDDAGTRCLLQGPLNEGDPTTVHRATPSSSTRIGNYTLQRKLGEGGMGVVYQAEQDPPLSRRVAIKIVKPGLEAPAILERFEAERSALARMNHPGIAAIHEAGVLDSGRPYFVMEYIDGLPITGWCDGHRLGLDERLELFLGLCEAVQHAHQKGLVHRDLKPSNVLVQDLDGIAGVKVIDFGIALDRPTDGSSKREMWGSVATMAPEIVDPTILDVDTRADVYGLGALLFELLSGASPFDDSSLSELGSTQLMRALQERETAALSETFMKRADRRDIARRRGARATAWARELRGDLDAIVARAMHNDRDSRYATVGALAADLRRFRAREPVAARNPGRRYIATRFVQRHARVALALGFATLLLIAGILGTSWGMFRAREDRGNALLVAQFLADVFTDGMALGSTTSGAPEQDQLAQLDALIEDGVLAESPLAEAAVRRAAGSAYRVLGDLERAEHHLLTGLDLVAEGSPDALGQRSSLLASLARVYLDQDGAQALDLFYVAEIGLVQSLAAKHPALGTGLKRMMHAVDLNQFEALPGIREEIVNEAVGTLPPGDSTWILLAELFAAEGEWAARMGDGQGGLSLLSEAFAIRQRELPPVHIDIARSHELLAIAYLRRGDNERGQGHAQAAMDLMGKLLPEGHWAIARAQSVLASSLTAEGMERQAEDLLRSSVEQLQEQRGDSHPATARALRLLVGHYERVGADDAAVHFRRLLANAMAISRTQEMYWGPQRMAFDALGLELLAAADALQVLVDELSSGPGLCQFEVSDEDARRLSAAITELQLQAERARAERPDLALIVGRHASYWASSLPCGADTQVVQLAGFGVAELEPHAERLGIELGEALTLYADALLYAGRPGEALISIARAQDLVESNASEPSNSLRAVEYERIEILAATGDFANALAESRISYQRSLDAYGSDHALTLTALSQLVSLNLAVDNTPGALALLEPQLRAALAAPRELPGRATLAWIVLRDEELSGQLGALAAELAESPDSLSAIDPVQLETLRLLALDRPADALDVLQASEDTPQDLRYRCLALIAKCRASTEPTLRDASPSEGREFFVLGREGLDAEVRDLGDRAARRPYLSMADRRLIDRALKAATLYEVTLDIGSR